MTENVSDFTKYLISHFYCNIYKPRIASTHVRRSWRSASKTGANVFIHMFDCWSVQSSLRSATLEHESVFESEHCDVTVSGHEHSGSSLRTLSRRRVLRRVVVWLPMRASHKVLDVCRGRCPCRQVLSSPRTGQERPSRPSR